MSKANNKVIYLSIIAAALHLGSSFAQNPRPIPSLYDYGVDLKLNYIRTWDVLVPETNPANLSLTTSANKARITTQYIDGLGRPIQTVIKQGSLVSGGTATDLVSTTLYDEFGRESFKYLPFAANNSGNNTHISDGLFKFNPFQQQAEFYGNPISSPIKGQGETHFYSQTIFEPSPLNRVMETFAPGDSWVGTSGNTSESARRSIKAKYYINTTVDSVRIWNVTNHALIGNWGSYSSPGAYPAGELYKNITIDENNKQVIEFKDKQGQVILKKVQLTADADEGDGEGYGGWLCTYYLYDDLGNLRCVIQPRGVELISTTWTLTNSTILAEQCFRYEYDHRNRMIMKKVPGAGEVNMVYDKRDRLVMTQDANMAVAPRKWMITKYDVLNRPIETGLWTHSGDASSHRSSALALAGDLYEYPTTSGNYELLTKTHYDDYTSLPTGLTSDFNNSWRHQFIDLYNAYPQYAQEQIATTQTRGMVTWTQTKILGTASDFEYSVFIYDDKGRVIQVKSRNATQGLDIFTTQYNWSGQPIITFQLVRVGDPETISSTVVTDYTYDDLGRLVKTEKRANSSQAPGGVLSFDNVTVSEQQYDALGQLKTKDLGRKRNAAGVYDLEEPLESLSYEYNIRGWLLGVNRHYAREESDDNYFGFDLGYDKIANNLIGGNTYAAAQYNGNISGTVWKSKGDNEKRKYDFSYDPVNRLMKADFNQYSSGTFDKTTNVDFSIKMGDGALASSAYDANGNILAMTQNGLKLNISPVIDQLTYEYKTVGTITTNKLIKVSDAILTSDNGSLGDFKDGANGSTEDYDYDPNGNLIFDKNKSISSITYNHLNLPSVITVDGKGTISYTYNAAGNKLKKETVDNTGTKSITTTTRYLSGVIYESKSTSPANTPNDDYANRLQFIPHEEGRIRPIYGNSATPNAITDLAFDYFLKDHLGNVRMVLTDEQKADIYQAGMEDAKRDFENKLFNNITQTVISNNKPTGFDSDDNNKNVSQLFSTATDKRTGPGVVLKVMAGDQFNAKVFGWYLPGVNNATYSGAISMITSLVNALSGGLERAGSKGTLAELADPAGILNAPISSFTNDPNRTYVPGRPKAYLNWILLDEEQLKLVSGNSGAVQVPSITGSMQKQLLQSNSGNDITITKNGYLYVYVSNESQGNVYFDDLRIEHIRGPILEETHYYPFGLTMAGISSKAAGSLENKKKFNDGTELNETFDINLYETNFRSLDPQLGRFWQIDPLADAAYEYSPFAYGNNNPLTFNDPLGLFSDSTGTPGFSPDNPKVLETVTVAAKPKVGSQFVPYISFPNGRPGNVASYKDWPLSFSRDRSNDLLDSWAMGLGAENRIYLPNHPMTMRLKNAYRIYLAKAYFYKKYLTNYKNGQSLKGASVTNYQGSFGLLGLVMAGTDLVEQFVGSFTVDIHVDDKGENLLFFVSNSTSSTSAFYHMADSHERVPSQLTPRGTMNQVFIWQEPISSSGFMNVTSPRPPAASPTTGIPGSPFQ